MQGLSLVVQHQDDATGMGKKSCGFVGKQIEKRIYLLESLELNLTFLCVYIYIYNYFFIFFGGQVTMSFRHFFSKRKNRWVSPKHKVCFPKRTTKSRCFPELSRAAPTPFPTQAAGDSPRWPMTWRCLPSPKSSGGFDNSWGSAAGTTHGDAGIDGMEPQAGIIYECFLSLNFIEFLGLYNFYIIFIIIYCCWGWHVLKFFKRRNFHGFFGHSNRSKALFKFEDAHVWRGKKNGASCGDGGVS